MTLLGFSNYILQFLFIRLTRCNERVITGVKPQTFSINPDGSTFTGVIDDYEIRTWYSIQYWVLPLTGWWDSFIYIGKAKFLRITKVVVSK